MTFMLESRWTRVMPAVAQAIGVSAGTHQGLSGLPPRTQSNCQLGDAASKWAEAEEHAPCNALL